MKRFSDFAKPSGILTGDKIRINDILGKEIEVIGYKISDSKQKLGTKYLTLQIRVNGQERVLFTGSNILIEQIEQYGHEIPFWTKIERVNRFFTFT